MAVAWTEDRLARFRATLAKNRVKKKKAKKVKKAITNKEWLKHLRRGSNVETDLGGNPPEFEPFVINRKHLKPVETSRRASDEPRQFWIDQIEELREERRRFEHNFYDAIMWMVRK